MVIRSVPLRDAPGVVELVERTLLEPDRERAERLACFLRGEWGERRGIDTAGKEHPDRHVADEMRARGVAQARAQLLQELGFVVAAQLLDRNWPRPRVAIDVDR